MEMKTLATAVVPNDTSKNLATTSADNISPPPMA